MLNGSETSSIQSDASESVSKSISVDFSSRESVPNKNEPLENGSSDLEAATSIGHERDDALEEGEIDDNDDSNGVNVPNVKESNKVNSSTNIESSNEIRLEPAIDLENVKIEEQPIQMKQENVMPTEAVIVPQLDTKLVSVVEEEEVKDEVKEEVKAEDAQLLQSSESTDLKTEMNSDKTENSYPNSINMDTNPISKVENYIAKLPIILNSSNETTTSHNIGNSNCLSNSSTFQEEPKTDNIQIENAEMINPTEQESISHINEDPSQHENTQANDSKENANTSGTSENKSIRGLDGVLNNSGNKSVNVISTSSKDYVFVEDENNETTVYITRKKKKKKDKKKTVAKS